jgi:hypothetical protein
MLENQKSKVVEEELVSTVVRKNHAETLNLVMTVNFVDG